MMKIHKRISDPRSAIEGLILRYENVETADISFHSKKSSKSWLGELFAASLETCAKFPALYFTLKQTAQRGRHRLLLVEGCASLTPSPLPRDKIVFD